MIRPSVTRLSRQALRASSVVLKSKSISDPLELFPSPPFFAQAFHPFHDLEMFGKEMNKMARIAPSLDIKESDDFYTAQMDLPDMSKDDIVITLKNGLLTVNAIKAHKEGEDSGSESGEGVSGAEGKEDIYHVRERSALQKYTRAWNIPKKVTQDEVKAELANGVLTITYPKHAEPEHTIPIE